MTMNTINEKQFNISELKGISAKNIEEHLKLYAGYVKHANLIQTEIKKLSTNIDENSFLINELNRRFSFEYNGVYNHEIFFESLSGGAAQINRESSLYKKISAEWDGFENWLKLFKNHSKTRGIGWAGLFYDPKTDSLSNAWVDEQHIGQLNGTVPILMIDMWEHSFVSDYYTSGKGQYVEDFFENLNWSKIEDNYERAIK